MSAPDIDPIVPIAEIEPDSPLLTCLKEKTRYGFFLDRKPISVAHVSAAVSYTHLTLPTILLV